MLITITQASGSIPCDLTQLPESIKKTISGQIKDLLTKVDSAEVRKIEQQENADITVVIEELLPASSAEADSEQDYSCVVCNIESEPKGN